MIEEPCDLRTEEGLFPGGAIGSRDAEPGLKPDLLREM